jgi:hypothetical protein
MTSSGTSDDRYTYPADGDDPRDIDRERTDEQKMAEAARDRAVTHPQDTERDQGTSADQPGLDPSDREREIEPDPYAPADVQPTD